MFMLSSIKKSLFMMCNIGRPVNIRNFVILTLKQRFKSQFIVINPIILAVLDIYWVLSKYWLNDYD